MADEEFTCRAINDYYASVTDELDLKEGQEYTIMQVSCMYIYQLSGMQEQIYGPYQSILSI